MRGRLRLLAAAALAFAVVATPTAARAGGGDDGIPTLPQGTPHVVDTGSCVLYANARGFGADCIAGDGGGLTVKQILNGDPFPTCRYDPVPDDMPATDPGPGKHNVLKTCLLNVDENGVTPGKTPELTTEVVPWDDDTPVPQLTPNQLKAWGYYKKGYPTPVPEFGPAPVPRVNLPTYVWLTPESSDATSLTTFDGNRQVPMRARLDRFDVWPGKSDSEIPVHCDGSGTPYDPALGIDGQTSDCVVTYQRSSASRPGGVYNMTITAYWDVEYQLPNGQWRLLAEYPMNNVFKTPVQEIQTIAD